MEGRLGRLLLIAPLAVGTLALAASEEAKGAAEIVTMDPSLVFETTGWTATAVQSLFFDALLTNQPSIGEALKSSVKSLPGDTQESLLRGLLSIVKAYVSGEMFMGEYGRQREKLYSLDPGREDMLIPRSGQDLLRLRLRSFSEESASVDFQALTELKWGMKIFVRPEYEGKSRVWKMCFRAGPRLTEVARVFATAWLSELQSAAGPTAKAEDHLRTAAQALQEGQWSVCPFSPFFSRVS